MSRIATAIESDFYPVRRDATTMSPNHHGYVLLDHVDRESVLGDKRGRVTAERQHATATETRENGSIAARPSSSRSSGSPP